MGCNVAKSLLIIGGSGFFGKSFLDAFRRGLLEPWGISSVIILARNAKQLIVTNPELIDGSNVFLINADIASCTSFPYADYIIHAAASTDASAYISNPGNESANILSGTSNFCAIAKNILPKSKILYISSGAVYGQQPPDLRFIPETHALSPLERLFVGKRDYASAKRDGEYLIRNLANDGFSVSIARCFAFVGKYLPRNKHFAIGNFFENGLNGCDIQVKAIGSVIRSYMYVDDLVIWLMTIISNSNDSCPIFNVGSNEAVEIRDLAKIFGDFYKVGVKYQLADSAIVDRYVPSIEFAASNLNLQLKFDLQSAIAETHCRIKSG